MKRGIARGAGQRFTVACNRTWGGHVATTRASAGARSARAAGVKPYHSHHGLGGSKGADVRPDFNWEKKPARNMNCGA